MRTPAVAALLLLCAPPISLQGTKKGLRCDFKHENGNENHEMKRMLFKNEKRVATLLNQNIDYQKC